MCKCIGVDFGTYTNSVALFPPLELGITRTPVTVDACIADEVIWIWNKGIVTTGNCCGHNKAQGFISVKDEFVDMMIGLGYEYHSSGLPNHFIPKSILIPSNPQ